MSTIINEKVATCYYKSTRTVVRNGHLVKMTKEIELTFVKVRKKVITMHIKVDLKSFLNIKLLCYNFPT